METNERRNTVNQVILIGNLTKDPEYRVTTGQNQTAICNFSIAVNDGYGERQQTSYIPIVVFGKSADNCNRYLRKGSKIAVHGRIQTRSYTNRNNQKVYVTEVVASNVEFLTPKNEASQNGQGWPPQGRTQYPQQQYPQQGYWTQQEPQRPQYEQGYPPQQEPQQEQIAFGDGYATLQDDDIPF